MLLGVDSRDEDVVAGGINPAPTGEGMMSPELVEVPRTEEGGASSELLVIGCWFGMGEIGWISLLGTLRPAFARMTGVGVGVLRGVGVGVLVGLKVVVWVGVRVEVEVTVSAGTEVGEAVGLGVSEVEGVGSDKETVRVLESPAEPSLAPVYRRSFRKYSPGPLYPESK